MSFDATEMLAHLFDAPAILAVAMAGGPDQPAEDEKMLSRLPPSTSANVHHVRPEIPHKVGDSPQPAGPFGDWVRVPDTRDRSGWQSPDATRPWPAWEDLPAWPDRDFVRCDAQKSNCRTP